MAQLSPIVLFAYNRPEHTRRLLLSLQRNPQFAESQVFAFSDAAKTSEDKPYVHAVRQLFADYPNVRLIIRKQNLGLANSIISGVSDVFKNHEQAIILEDDLVVSSFFLEYMNEALKLFKTRQDIFSISGYCAPINLPQNYNEDTFLFNRINSWGWASWRDRWHSVDWKLSDFKSFINDKKAITHFNRGGKDSTIMLLKQQLGLNESWAIRFNYAAYKQNRWTVYPRNSLIKNQGVDSTGTNMMASNKYETSFSMREITINKDVKVNPEICRIYKNFFKPSLFRQIINFAKVKAYQRGFVIFKNV